MNRILCYLAALLLFSASTQAQSILNPADPVYTYNSGSASGSLTNPTPAAANTIKKWVRKKRLSWNTDKYKAYTIGNAPFRLRYPNSYVPGVNDGKKFPVVVFFHGGGEATTDPFDNEFMLFNGAERFGNYVDAGMMDAYILFLQTPYVDWNVTQFTAINIIVDSLIKNCKADEDRIISMGLSIGGAVGAINYADTYPKRVARIIPSSPAFITSYNGYIPTIIHIPMWVGSGGQDTNPYPSEVQNYQNAFNAQGGDLIYSFYPNVGHVMWDYQWGEPFFATQWNQSHKANPLVFFNRKQYPCGAATISSRMGITPGFAQYEWSKDDVTIGGATSNEYTATSLGVYRVRFKRTATSDWSAWSPNPAVIYSSCPGNGVGLTANYYNNVDFTPPVVVNRVDPTINLTLNATTLPDPAVNQQYMSTRWTGKVQAQVSETYTFYTTSDDGVRLWVNGQLLIDNYNGHAATENSATIDLLANQKYDIRIDYYNGCCDGTLVLRWSSPSTPKAIVPQTQLYPDPVTACITTTVPANGATIATQTTAALSWGTVPTATSYDVYVWSGATPPSTPTATVTTPSYNATGLTASTQYKWNVIAKNISGAATACSANSVTFTTGGPVPGCATNSAPANGSTIGTQTSANLTWGSVATATSYDVYVWTGATPPVSPTANVATPSYSASGLLAGTLYNWYVAPRNGSGPATGCATTNKSTFTTAAAAIPACTSNLLPANGSILASQSTAALSWNTVAAATSYDVFLWTGATPPAIATTNTSSASYNASGLTPGTLYNWYIVPKNASGSATGCALSNTSTFTTASAVTPVPGCATNTLPANGSTIATPTTASLTWSTVAAATSYDVYIWTGATVPTSPTVNVATNSYSAAGLVAGSLYNWYVAPRNATGPATGCDVSNKSTFTTAVAVPVCATNTLPADGSILATTTTASLSWSSVSTATSYDVYLWTGATAPTSPTVNVATNSYSAAGLVAGSLYNWYVAPRNATGPATGCNISNKSTFTTAIPLPVCATNTLPANGASLATTTTASLSWGAVPTAVSYDVYIWTGATAPVSPTANVPIASYSASGLVAGTLYNWYVAPRNATGAATGCDISNTSTFTTAVAVPACVTNTLPVNGSTIATSATATLTWGSAVTAVSYDVYIWTGATVPTLPTANVATNSYNAFGLTPGSLYNWYIAPRNAAGAATGCDISNKSTFTTAVAVPVCATNTLPVNGSTIATPTTASLTWSNVAAATSYDVYIWTGATVPTSPTANVTTNSYSAAGLTASSLYNWYIVPRNTTGPAAGCDVSNKSTFTTAAALPVCATNTLPTNGATIATQTTASLTWSSVAAATSYDVYLWTGATVPTSPTANVATNSYSAAGLLAGTLYNWYIVPRNATGAATGCDVSNKSTFTTAVAVPVCATNTLPVNGSTVAAQNSAVLSWSSVATATSYDVYIWSGATVPTTPTANTTTPSYSANGLTAGTLYNWYVIPKNAGGAAVGCDVTNATSFTTAAVVVPSCATNSLPVNGATIATQNTATLTWGAVAAATSYDVYIWTGATVPTTPTATVAVATYSATGLVAGSLYNWYVVPKNAGGAATGCDIANATTFTTAPAAPPCATNSLPANGSTIASSSAVTLTWSTVPTAASYDVYLWTGATPPASPTTNVTATSFSTSGLAPATFYSWYIVPRNTGGAAANCDISNKSTFTTGAIAAPACAVNNLPADGSIIASQTTASLSWGSVSTATSYDIYIWTGGTPPSSPTANSTLPSYTAGGLVAASLYNWYVVPKNASGSAAGCAATSTTSFTTASAGVTPPVCATNSLPANGSTIATQNTATLTWGSIAAATSYDVYIWTGATPPASPIVNQAGTSYNATSLVAGTLYNWYVVPRNAGGPATGCDLSNKSTFTTAAVPVPGCATITLPVNGTTLLTQNTATLTWSTVAAATAYDVYLWTGATIPVTPAATVTAATYGATGLIAGSLYHWYIVPKNASGAATGCDISNGATFTTAAIPVPACATNSAPVNGTTIATTTTATLAWSTIAAATSYDVYLWTGATAPSTPVANVTAANYDASGLIAGSLYHWYVVPKNAGGPAAGCDLSNATTFTTASVPVPVCATNTLPANGSTLATPTTASLTWSNVSTATSYDVYIWTGATAPTSPTVNVATNSYSAAGLVAGALYNWYVAPRNASGPATGCDISNKSTFTTAAAVPVCATNTLPTNGSTIATPTTVLLTWGNVAAATSYDVYIWTGATVPTSPTVNVATNSYSASSLTPGSLYNWYIVPRNATGPATGCDVSNKSTFTTAAAVPVCATNTLPTNGSTIATPTTVLLTWGNVAAATSYDVYIWTGATVPTSPTVNVATNSYSASSLTPGSLYNWYIVPRNATGPATGCDVSNKSTFTTAAAVPVCATNTLPANGSTLATTTTATLTWSNVSTATSYDVYIWTGATVPTSPTVNVATNSYSAAGLVAGSLYNWYIVPRNATGPATGCDVSNKSTFTTAAAIPVCATNTLPANGSTLATTTTATLTWSNVSTATSYDVYIWTGATVPTSPTVNVATNSYSASSLTPGSLYNWYIVPRNATGPATGCDVSNKSTFTTAVAVPVCATNTLPANGSTLATTTATLTWSNVSTATSYDVYIWTGATVPTSPTVNVATNSYSAAGLVAGSLYNWYIVPRNATGPATGCDVSNKSTFTTAAAVPVCATNTLPANGSTLATTTTATLTWSNVSTATSYDVYLWTGATVPTSPIINVATNSYSAAGLVAGSLYNWYIVPRNASGPATGCDISNKSTFTTASVVAVPACATNSSPVNGSTVPAQTSASLAWSSVSTATSYDVYIWTGATVPTIPTVNVATNSYNAAGLVAGTLYNWYVAPRNAAGPATGCGTSNKSTFTTATASAPGTGTGLRGDYFNNITVTDPVVASRIDPTVNYTWPASPAAGVVSENFSVRWTGKVEAVFSETYTFYTRSDDGARLWVNGVQLVNDFNYHGTTENSGSITLVAGQKYDIRMEFFDGCCDAVAMLLWSSPSTPKAVVPQIRLYPDAIVIPAPPACVVNSAPVNGSTLLTQTTATLTWPAAATATSYDVYLWTGATVPAAATANVTGTSYSATGLTASTLYNWYIVPKNAGGDASGCAVSNRTSFTTAAVPGAGTGTGLKGDYFNGITVTDPVVVSRVDPTVNFTWPGSPAASLPTDNFSVRWTGKVQPVYSETYTFYTRSDDGIRLWVNGVQIINNFTNHGTIENSGTITLVGGQKYDIRLEFYDACCDAVAMLLWSSPSTTKAIIPQTQLYPDAIVTPPPPACVINTAPVNGATIPTQTTATLTWPASATATSYDVYLWTGASAPATPTITQAGTSYSVTGLTASTLYNWYVVPKNGGGDAAGCAVSNKTTFTTAAVPGAGTGTGLKGEYFNNTTVTNPVVFTRTDATVNYIWAGVTSPNAAVTADNFSIRWTGKVQPVYSETYTFYTRTDDGVRLWVNGVQLINDFNNHGTLENSGTITLVGGQKYDIRMEYYDACCDAVVALLWSSASTPKAVIPQTQLYLPDAALVAAAATTPVIPMVTADLSAAVTTLSSTISPNPVTPGQSVRLQINSNNAVAASVQIINSNGNVISTQKLNLLAGVNTTTVNTSALGQGFYIVRIIGGDTPVNIKLLVE